MGRAREQRCFWKSAADEADRIVAEKKNASCPDVIAAWLTKNAPDLACAGTETRPLAVWRWNELLDKGLPIVCMDARHANAIPEASFLD
jgi:transposase